MRFALCRVGFPRTTYVARVVRIFRATFPVDFRRLLKKSFTNSRLIFLGGTKTIQFPISLKNNQHLVEAQQLLPPSFRRGRALFIALCRQAKHTHHLSHTHKHPLKAITTHQFPHIYIYINLYTSDQSAQQVNFNRSERACGIFPLIIHTTQYIHTGHLYFIRDRYREHMGGAGIDWRG